MEAQPPAPSLSSQPVYNYPSTRRSSSGSRFGGIFPPCHMWHGCIIIHTHIQNNCANQRVQRHVCGAVLCDKWTNDCDTMKSPASNLHNIETQTSLCHPCQPNELEVHRGIGSCTCDAFRTNHHEAPRGPNAHTIKFAFGFWCFNYIYIYI